MALLKTNAIIGVAIAGVLMLPAVSQASSRITASQARGVALHRISGKVISTKYELEDGHWQYAILLRRGSVLYEVNVNAETGRITSTERTSQSEENTEAAGEQRGN